MRRDARKTYELKWWEDKKIILSGLIITMSLVLIIGIAVFSNNQSRYNSRIDQEQIISLVPENEIQEETESASTTVGKSIEDSKSESKNNVTNSLDVKSTTNTVGNNAGSNNINKKTDNNTATAKQSTQTNAKVENKKEVEFQWPVKGDILKAFSVDNLLFSSTLQEWTVHNGIDIKADKTTIVSSAADGNVKSIKNDPRYGLSITIEHDNGFKTVYSNLLTAEFVVEGEKVKAGQTIGTVGNSANFEISDESHLHFEILKDGEYVDPTMYLK